MVNRGAGTLGGLPNLKRAGDFYEFCENVIQFYNVRVDILVKLCWFEMFIDDTMW